MFDGYLTFGGVEIANHARLAAYIAEGLIPEGVTLGRDCKPCDGLSVAVGDPDDYQNPALDEPPWYDIERPEAQDFAGLLMLGITGLSGTTRQVPVTDRLGDGGIPGRPRRGPRVIGASALLIGRTTASVETGLAWLTTALAGGCTTVDACGGLDVAAFIDCPSGCVSPDPDSDMDDYPVDPCDVDWFPIGGVYTCGEDDGQFDVSAEVTVIDGGDSTGSGLVDDIEGGDATGSGPDIIDGGDSSAPSGGGLGLLTAPVVASLYDEVIAVWTISPISPATSVEFALGATTPDGTILDQQVYQTSPGGVFQYEVTYPGWGDWRPAIWVTDPGVVVSLVLRHRRLLTLEECTAALRRRYPNVVTATGPTVVQEYETSCGGAKMTQVEWTWVAGDPYRYTAEVMLVDQMPSDGTEPEDKGTGVQTGSAGVVTAIDTACDDVPEPDECGTNPCCTTGLPAPPLPPVIADCFEQPVDYNRSYIIVPEALVPNSNAILSFAIANGSETDPIVGARIRVHPNDDPDVSVDDECAFVYEATVEYIPPGSTIEFDGPTGQIMMRCPGPAETTIVSDARTMVRGAYGGPLGEAVVGCSRSYIITVDAPRTYAGDCGTGDGDPQPTLTWDALLTPREG